MFRLCSRIAHNNWRSEQLVPRDSLKNKSNFQDKLHWTNYCNNILKCTLMYCNVKKNRLGWRIVGRLQGHLCIQRHVTLAQNADNVTEMVGKMQRIDCISICCACWKQNFKPVNNGTLKPCKNKHKQEHVQEPDKFILDKILTKSRKFGIINKIQHFG